jgi:hypothetical protein
MWRPGRPWFLQNKAFSGAFTPVLAKHSKSFSPVEAISVGVDRMQQNFGPFGINPWLVFMATKFQDDGGLKRELSNAWRPRAAKLLLAAAMVT